VFLGEWTLNSLSVFFIGHFYSASETGIYSVAISISSLFLTLKATLVFFWFSTASNLLQNNKKDQFEYYFANVLKIYTALSFITLFVYLLFSKEFIFLLTSKEYLDANFPIIILVFGYCFYVMASIFNGTLYALGETKKILISYIIASIINLISNGLLTYYYGITGASFSVTFSYFVLMGSMLGYISYYNLRPKIKSFPALLFIGSAYSILLLLLSFYEFGLISKLFIISIALGSFLIIGEKLKFFNISIVASLIKDKNRL
jgi:O-antigen/teichoic acid export membrane protein